MAAFNASTAYADDYQYLDGVTTETLTPRDDYGQDSTPTRTIHVKRGGDVTEPDMQGFAQALGLVPDDAILTIWPDSTSDAAPAVGDKLTWNSASWQILGVRDQCWGPVYQCAVRKEL